MKTPPLQKLKQRIIINIVVLPTFFVLLISSISGVFLFRYVQDEYENMAYDSVALNRANLEFSLDILSSDMRLLADDVHVNSFVSTGQNGALAQSKLSMAVASDPHLLGLSLYGLGSSIILGSTNVSGLPTLSQITSDSPIATFIESDETSGTFIRHQNIADNFNYASFDESYGIMSQLIKIIIDDVYRGLLLADLDTSYIYDTYFAYDRYETFPEVITFIRGNSGHLKMGSNLPFEPLLDETIGDQFAPIGTKYSGFQSGGSSFNIISIFSMSEQRRQLAIILLTIGLLDILLVIASIFVGKRMLHRIVAPLETIVSKMKQEKFSD